MSTLSMRISESTPRAFLVLFKLIVIYSSSSEYVSDWIQLTMTDNILLKSVVSFSISSID